MARVLTSLCLLAVVLWSCGPDKPRACSGQDPDFEIVLKLAGRPLPRDTVVRVTYAGSGVESYRLSQPDAKHEVTFCEKADENGVPLDADASASAAPGAAGTAGETADPQEAPVASLFCRLYTGGFTKLDISGSGFEPVSYQLAPKHDVCTVEEPPIVLDPPDAG